MEYHPGRDVHPSERTEVSQSIEGFDQIAVIRVDTVLRNERETIESELGSLYVDESTTGHHNAESGESSEIRLFSNPIDDTLLDEFDTVLTYLRANNSLFVDLFSVAVLSDKTHKAVVGGERQIEASQHILEEFFSGLSTINESFPNSSDELEGLPITSLVVGVPSVLPPVRTIEDGFKTELIQKFTTENSSLLHTINFQIHGPASAVTPDKAAGFIISNQSPFSPFGPYAAVYFHPKDSTRHEKTRPKYNYADGFRSLVPLFRRFNWLRHRKSEIGDAEDRLLQANTKLNQIESPSPIDRIVGKTPSIATYESLLEEFRSDILISTQIQQELESLGNPYREKTSLQVQIDDAFPISENSSFVQMINDGVYQNLVVYCIEEEKFVHQAVDRVVDRHQIARESLFAEISVSSTRWTIRLQRILLALTIVLVLLTIVMVAPVVIDYLGL